MKRYVDYDICTAEAIEAESAATCKECGRPLDLGVCEECTCNHWIKSNLVKYDALRKELKGMADIFATYCVDKDVDPYDIEEKLSAFGIDVGIVYARADIIWCSRHSALPLIT